MILAAKQKQSILYYKGEVLSGLQKGGNGGNVFPANLTFWQPFWLMILVLLTQNKLYFISGIATASQKWLQDQNGFHPKVTDSQVYMPVKSGCQEVKKILPAKISCQPNFATRVDASQ